jgi:hypothetical protein
MHARAYTSLAVVGREQVLSETTSSYDEYLAVLVCVDVDPSAFDIMRDNPKSQSLTVSLSAMRIFSFKV